MAVAYVASTINTDQTTDLTAISFDDDDGITIEDFATAETDQTTGITTRLNRAVRIAGHHLAVIGAYQRARVAVAIIHNTHIHQTDISHHRIGTDDAE